MRQQEEPAIQGRLEAVCMQPLIPASRTYSGSGFIFFAMCASPSYMIVIGNFPLIFTNPFFPISIDISSSQFSLFSHTSSLNRSTVIPMLPMMRLKSPVGTSPR